MMKNLFLISVFLCQVGQAQTNISGNLSGTLALASSPYFVQGQPMIVSGKLVSRITLYNMRGMLEYEFYPASYQFILNGKELSPSLYFLYIDFDDGTRVIQKVLKN